MLIRLLTEDLSIMSQAFSQKKDAFFENLEPDILPKMSDLYEALSGINRIVKTYRFSVDDVIKGKFSETTRAMFELDGRFR